MDNPSQTLGWIVDLLQRLEIPFQAVGGLAAHAYGATRPLADLDFYIPTARLADIAHAAAPYLVRPPSHHRDESWDLVFMKIEYQGHEIELAGAEGARFFNRRAGQWQDANINFDESVGCSMFGVSVPVMPLAQLIAYRRGLNRAVDQEDVAELVAAELEAYE